MSELDNFTGNFSDRKIESVQVKNNFFTPNPELKKISSIIKQEPFSAGLFLGEIRKNRFVPRTPLLDMLSKMTDRKVFVNRKTEWLFLCGRDIFGSGIVNANETNGLVLVQNELDENLGYGKIIADLSLKDKVVINNLFDNGDFLRRERSHSFK